MTLGSVQVRKRIFVFLLGILVTVCLSGCSSGDDQKSGSSGSAAEQLATSRVDTTASRDTSAGQEQGSKSPADTSALNGGMASPRDPTASSPPDTAAAKPPSLGEVLARHGDELRAIHGVVSVDSVACDVGSCIQVTVTRRTQSVMSQLPATIEGYPVVVKERSSGH